MKTERLPDGAFLHTGTAAEAAQPVLEARLAAVRCREDAVTVEELRLQGWEVAGGDTRYGSVWMTRPVQPPVEQPGTES